MQAEPFVRAALAAIDDCGDPCDVRTILESALVTAAPLERLPRPANAKKRVVWAARQLAIAADQPARAYERLRELVAALYEPLATSSEAVALGLPSQPTMEFAAGQAAVAGPPRASAPAPEVAAGMSPAQLIEMLAPSPRVLAREIAVTLDVDPMALIAEPALERRVLGIRAIKQASIGKYADQLAAVIVGTDVGTGPAAGTEASGVAESGMLRFEAIAICAPAAESIRARVVSSLARHLEDTDPRVRAKAIDGMRQLKLPLGDERLASLLHDRDPDVRIAASRSVIRGPFPASVEMAIVSRLADDDPRVRAAALGAVIRTPSLHGPALVEPLREVLRRSEQAVAGADRELARNAARDAVYLLGRLGALARDAAMDVALAIASAVDPRQTGEALASITRGDAPDPRILAALNDAVTGPRSDASRAAAMVLESLGAPVPELSMEARVVRAATELASTDRIVQRAGLFEAKRLGRAAVSLIPALKTLAEQLAAGAVETSEARLLRSLARDTLTALGVPAGELPRPPSRLEAYRGLAPRELEVHGAYAIGEVGNARGLWDNGTGKQLFVVDDARALAFVPGRAEIAVIRIDTQWHFERYAVPSGERLASTAIPSALTYGLPLDLAIAGDLVTVWCGDKDAPYRFHIKLAEPDRVIDEAPVLGAKPSERSRSRR